MASDSKTVFTKFIFPIIGIAILLGVSWRNQSNAPGPDRKPVSSAANASLPVTGGAYDLSRDEDSGGHTLARHVARTDDQLRERLDRERNISAASTWTDRPTAERAVGIALNENRDRISQWLGRTDSRANLVIHYHGREPIGRSIRRGSNSVQTCYDAILVLRSNDNGGFYVLTTYPEAQ